MDGIEMISAVGHELRSPLTSIRGYTSLLLNRWDRVSDEDKLLMLTQIQADADRVTRLINELLDISRLESGHLTLAVVPVFLAEVVGEVLTSLRAVHPDLDPELRGFEELPAVPADRDKVTQVLTNLVENACKYGKVEGMTLEASQGPELVSVTVADRGPGLETTDSDRVFERWFQREQGRPSGTGLGLWISRGLIEAHGGTLTVTSVPGEGAAFTFSLPLR